MMMNDGNYDNDDDDNDPWNAKRSALSWIIIKE